MTHSPTYKLAIHNIGYLLLLLSLIFDWVWVQVVGIVFVIYLMIESHAEFVY